MKVVWEVYWFLAVDSCFGLWKGTFRWINFKDVSIADTSVRDFLQFDVFYWCRSPYIPEYKRSGWKSPSTEKYVYGAAPPPTPRLETLDTPKVEQGSDNTGNASGESIKKKEAGGDYIVVSSAHGVKEAYVNGLNEQQIGMEERGTEVTAAKSGVSNKRASDGTGGSGGAQPRGGPLPALSPSSVRKRESRDQVSAQAPVAMLATDLECALLQVLMCRSQDSSSSVSSNGFRSGIASPGNGTARAATVPPKESSSDITQVCEPPYEVSFLGCY